MVDAAMLELTMLVMVARKRMPLNSENKQVMVLAALVRGEQLIVVTSGMMVLVAGVS